MSLPTAAAPFPPTAPKSSLPRDACDAHVHLVGQDFALWDKRVENPSDGSLAQWLDRYRTHLTTLGCTRGVLVHSILYGADNSITLAATRAMGSNFRAVCLISDDATEAQIADLADKGTKAVRLNYVHGGILSWEGAKRLAPVLADYGLHIEMLAHSHLHLQELESDVRMLAVPVVFDHCAWPDMSLGLETKGNDALKRLLADGHAYTKLSALYRFTDQDDSAKALIETLATANPERILWGSDWPHLMLNGVKMPDATQQLNTVLDALSNSATQHRLFTSNPARLYGFAP